MKTSNVAENIEIVKYNKSYYGEWNSFVRNAKNSTFLFHRDFMDYHKDRYEDFSLLIYKKNKLQAILPANKLKHEIFSHQGLTYGGLILSRVIKFDVVIGIFKELLIYLKNHEIESLILKQIPSFYSDMFSQEIDYLMFVLNAELQKKETLSVIDLSNRIKMTKARFEGFKRANKHGLVVKEENDFELFWNHILIENLKNKHNVKPVHTLEEIKMLRNFFPKNIRQFNVYDKDKIVAGTTVFETKHVVHSQYISGNEDKNTIGSLDFLHIYLIENIFKDKKYFDLGSSNQQNGRNINKGLQHWKEGFGARTVTQDFYKVNTANFDLLNKVFV